MQSLPQNYCAIIVGATGGLGASFVSLLEQDKNCGKVYTFSTSTRPAINFDDESSIERAAQSINEKVHLFIDATGFLSDAATTPEKSLKSLNAENMIKLFTVNAVGPALLMKHFTPLMPRKERAIFATLSARVGSISDNHLGGWHSYRAAKAALNMVLKCTAIEMNRTKPHALCVALHPGTVATPLSDPFASDRKRLTGQGSAKQMLAVLDGLSNEQTGTFWDYNGKMIAW